MPADPQQHTGTSSLQIPPDLQSKHPELIALILGSQSMNDEERQYWINIVPIMTPDQLSNLRDILENEKRQLAAIDQKYSKEIQQIDAQQLVQKTEEERRKRRDQLSQQETATQQTEKQKEEELLREMQNF